MTGTVSLRDQLSNLFDLQSVDEEIRERTERKRGLVKHARTQEAKRNEEQARLDEHKQAHTDVQLAHRKKNTELVATQEKLVGFQGKQQQARDANEYVAFGKQIETTTHIANELEEETIALLLAVDEAKDALDAENGRFDQVEADYQEQRKKIVRAIRRLDSDVEERRQLREQRTTPVDTALLQDYERWRERSDLTMVAMVVTIDTRERAGKNSPITRTYSCGSCHMTVPTQMVHEAKSLSERRYCPACHRILLVPDEEPVEESVGEPIAPAIDKDDSAASTSNG